MYIDSAVADGEVTAENLTVRGNVYINGGGDASVVFQNCRVNGNIYVNKTVNGEPVAVKFDQTTAQNCKGTVIVQNNGAVLAPTDSASEVKLPKVTVETQKAVAIQTNVAELRVTVDQSALTIGGIVDWLWTDHTVFMTLVGNGEVRKTDGAVTETIAVESIQLDETTLKLTEGEAKQLKATVNPENATNRTVEWKSSDTTIATVEETGKVTAVKAGDATITATADGKTAECQVTVEPKIVPVESIQLDETTLKLTEGEARQLKATVNPENATNRTVEWKSSDTTIATVEETGKVTAVKAGDATITATADGKTAECQVTVEPKIVPVESIQLDETTLKLTEGEARQLKATVNPENATNRTVEWKSSDTTIATVEETGKVTAVKAGDATITATADGAKTAECQVIVKPKIVPVESIQLDETTLKLTEGEARQLKATVNPENATNRTVEWKSSDTTIATVDETGKVTAVKAGDATITATADGAKTAECQVIVEQKIVPVESIQLDETTLKLTEGEARQLKATVAPDNATNQKVTWSSSRPEVATVDETGKVTAVKAGGVTITATADGKTAKCQVTTVEPVAVTGVSLSPEAVQLAVGTTTTLKATVAPDNATNQKVTWSSSNPEVATVEGNGLITAKAIGQAEIEVKTAAGAKTAICKIEVTAAATGNNVSMTMF